MARITQRLTAIEVMNLKAKGLYPDGDGLYLRVTNTGTKFWIFRFAQRGITRDMGLGPLKDVSLANARKLAAAARRRLLEGSDPIEAREHERRQRVRRELMDYTPKICLYFVLISSANRPRRPLRRHALAVGHLRALPAPLTDSARALDHPMGC